jgi:hypothetical protein
MNASQRRILLGVYPGVYYGNSVIFPGSKIVFKRYRSTGYFNNAYPRRKLSIGEVKELLNAELSDVGIRVVSYRELTDTLRLLDGTPVVKQMIVNKTPWYFISESDRRVYSGAGSDSFGGIFTWYESSARDYAHIQQKTIRLFSTSSKKKREAFTVWYEDAVAKVALLNKMRGTSVRCNKAIIAENELAVGYEQGKSIFEIVANCTEGAFHIVVPPIEHIPVAAFTREANFLIY